MGCDHVILFHIVVKCNQSLLSFVCVSIVKRDTIINIETTPSLIVLIQEYLQRDPIVDTRKQRHAILMLKDWNYRAPFGPHCLLIGTKSLVVHPLTHLCISNFDSALPFIPYTFLWQIVINFGQTNRVEEDRWPFQLWCNQ